MISGIIRAIRLPECFLIVLLSVISFKFSDVPINYFALFSLFLVVAVTMLQNDYRDRYHDIKKGKKFAYEHSTFLLYCLVIVWIICLCAIGILFVNFPKTALLLMGMTIVGAFYSEARRIPFLSVTLVTLTVGSSLLLPITFGSNFSNISLIFLTTIFIMFGRETIHDIADIKSDKNYKKTLPTIFGSKKSQIISTACLIIGCILAMIIHLISISGSIIIFWGLTRVMSDKKLKWVRNRIDIGLVLLVLGFLVI